MKTLCVLAALLLGVVRGHGQPAARNIEFSGYLRAKKEPQFILTDLEQSQVSGWLALGETFRGYTIVAFDEKNEVLTLKGSTGLIALTLKQSKVTQANSVMARKELEVRVSPDGLLLVGNDKIELSALREKLTAVAMTEPTATFHLLLYTTPGDSPVVTKTNHKILRTVASWPIELKKRFHNGTMHGL